ncbi:DUF2059 domain-containing protein [Mesoterricola silvestris]|uniref:DUF2059 domain-containing protein n=1 Tax=Mesoterricola silvestris TaxID=2927979 RepID=UPI00292FC169|nr:DUF2059 domain-containing protein [Mesoterricola silvestris]
MKFTTGLSILFLTALPLMAVEDTEANRLKAAERYLAATPVSELMNDLVEQMGKNQPSEKQAWIKTVMTNCLDMKAIETIMRKSMIKTFTADELNALADFYASPYGKSAMKKFGLYMADAMPETQQEIMKAVEKSKAMIPEPK